MIEGGVIEPIVDLLESTDNPQYQKFAVLALANIAIHISAIPRIMHTKILKPLIDMCYLVVTPANLGLHTSAGDPLQNVDEVSPLVDPTSFAQAEDPTSPLGTVLISNRYT